MKLIDILKEIKINKGNLSFNNPKIELVIPILKEIEKDNPGELLDYSKIDTNNTSDIEITKYDIDDSFDTVLGSRSGVFLEISTPETEICHELSLWDIGKEGRIELSDLDLKSTSFFTEKGDKIFYHFNWC